jgi:hypothetical protein
MTIDINKLINDKIERALARLRVPTEKLEGQIPGGILPPASETPYASGTPDFSDLTGTLSDAQHGNRANGTLHDVAEVGTPGFVSPDGTSIAIDSSGVLSVVPPAVRPAFSVNKNGTDQTGIVPQTFTKVTWSSKKIDRNNDFSTANSRFQPNYPSSALYLMSANVTFFFPVYQKRYVVSLYKNGSEVGRSDAHASGTTYFSMTVTAIEEANGTTDYFEVYVWHDAGSNQTVAGLGVQTYFSGSLI